jgi:hypothetical protein
MRSGPQSLARSRNKIRYGSIIIQCSTLHEMAFVVFEKAFD